MSNELNPVAKWVMPVTLGLSLLGLALSIYLTIAHFQGTQVLACNSKGFIDCALVTTSAESKFLGVPVVFLGLGNYLTMVGLNSPMAWRSTNRRVHQVRFVLSMLGLAFILWLVYAEFVILNHICLYCTGVHIVTLALALVMSQVGPRQLGWAK